MNPEALPELLFTVFGWVLLAALYVGIPLLFTDFYLGFPGDLIARRKAAKGELTIIDCGEYIQLAKARPRKYVVDPDLFRRTVYGSGYIDDCLYLPRKEAKKFYRLASESERETERERRKKSTEETMELLSAIRSGK